MKVNLIMKDFKKVEVFLNGMMGHFTKVSGKTGRQVDEVG